MTKPFAIVSCVNLAIIVLAFIANSGLEDALAVSGIVALLLCPVNLLIGAIVAIIGRQGSQVRATGLSMMLISGLSLLCGIGLCSQVAMHF